MTARFAVPFCLVAVLATAGGDVYAATPESNTDTSGRITALESVRVDDTSRFGMGAAGGAVVGGYIGSQLGRGATGTVAGAAAGAAIGNYAQMNPEKKDAQRVSVDMASGGQVTVVQPVDRRLSSGMAVRVEGSGETARVVPR